MSTYWEDHPDVDREAFRVAVAAAQARSDAQHYAAMAESKATWALAAERLDPSFRALALAVAGRWNGQPHARPHR